MPIDFADEAQQLSELHLEESLKKRKVLTIPFSGFCLNCSEPVGQQRYCDSDCRKQHELAMRRKR